MQKHIPLRCFAVLLLVLLLSGCSDAGAPSRQDRLWVLTERSNADGMNAQAERIARQLEEDHQGLTVELELLPTETAQREKRIKQLQAQIMAGGGPDVYLLPTGNRLVMDYPKEGTLLTVEPLFPDVQQAMLSGLFRDISACYDADTELGKDALKTEIMDAGCLGEKRYVLPMRFDMDLLLVDRENCAAAGLDPALAEEDIFTLAEAVLTSDSGGLGAYALQLPEALTVLPQTFAYEKGELLLSAEELADYMRLYQQWTAVQIPLTEKVNAAQLEQYVADTPQYANNYQYDGYPIISRRSYNTINGDFSFGHFDPTFSSYKLHWSLSGFPFYTDNMEYLLDSVLMCKKLGRDYAVLPLRGADGRTSASVTYYGAVGGGCADPALAYEFLREFLTEEYQWDLYRPRVKKDDDPNTKTPVEPQRYILVEQSWPVRTVGCIAPLWDNRMYQLYFVSSSTYGKLLALRTPDSLTEADFPILRVPLDTVYFPIVQDGEETLAYALHLLNDENGVPTDVDIDALAEKLHLNLWWHLAEG